MGEAKRRTIEIQRQIKLRAEWREGLSAEEREIFQTAERLEERLVRGKNFTEGCYHLAFFMTRYLAEKGIQVTPVIGWVNDGTWDGVTSHAWIEYQGRKTDVSLTRTSHPAAQPTGSLIILDRTIRKGHVEYTYYKNDDPTVLKTLELLRVDPQLAPLQAQKEAQHLQMMEIARSNIQGIDAYLSEAPEGSPYNDIMKLLQ